MRKIFYSNLELEILIIPRKNEILSIIIIRWLDLFARHFENARHGEITRV